MSETKSTHPAQPVIVDEADRVTGFWEANSKKILIALTAVILVIAAFLGYKEFVSKPAIKKANEALFRAEAYFREDSLQLALNGDAINPGFVKIIDKYSGTAAANLATFYAGASYLKLGDYKNAEKYLKDFSTDAIQIQARAKSLLADAKSELGQKEEAAKLYLEAGRLFEKDDYNSPDYLFRAGYLYESLGKRKEALEAYKLIKEKYPRSERGFDIDKYLARLGDVD